MQNHLGNVRRGTLFSRIFEENCSRTMKGVNLNKNSKMDVVFKNLLIAYEYPANRM